MKIPFFKNKVKLDKIAIAGLKKSFIQGRNCGITEAINFQIESGAIRPYFETYIRFYASISPLGDSIDLIASQFASIQPKVFDIKTKEFSDDHPILDLLKNPNMNEDYCQFAQAEASFFELTGNQYWIITLSKIDGEPLELFVVQPQTVTYVLGSDGIINSYIYSYYGVSINFVRQDKERKIVYISEDGTQELFVLKNFNPTINGYRIIGLSKLHSMFYELMQYRLSSIHNQSLLENGARPAGMLTTKENLINDQLNELRSEFDAVFSGVTNAGRPMIGSQLEWTSFAQSNIDMDFATLKTQLKEAIYNRLKIPLPLVNPDALSLANMEVAMIQLYVLSIIPLAIKIFSVLTMNVLRKYKNSENLILTFDPATIPALKNENIKQIQEQAKLNVLSDNEIRNRLDFPDYEGGDEIYKPSTMIPVGSADNMSNTAENTNTDSDTTNTNTNTDTDTTNIDTTNTDSDTNN